MRDGPATIPSFSDDPVRVELALARRARREERRQLWHASLLMVSFPLLFAAWSLFMSMGTLDPAPMDTSRNVAFELGKSCELFKLQNGRYPHALAELVDPPRGRPILKRVPVDEWGREFLYVLPGLRHPKKFDVVSLGADGLLYTGDDRGNFSSADEPEPAR